MSMEDNELNPFETSIPGQSLVSGELGSVPFETPPDFPDPEDFYMFAYEKLMDDDDNLMNVVKLLEMDVTADAIVEGILMNAFMMGQISPDTGVIMKGPLIDLVTLIGQEADVEVPRRDDAGALKRNVSIDEALVRLSDETPEMEEGDTMMEDDMADEPSGMMAPPDGMDDMMPMDSAMDEMPMDDMPEQEEEEEQTALMMR